MNFYSFEEIAQHGSCIRYMQEVLGERVVNGRCRAVWRGGTNPQSVSVKDAEWYDFSREQGGGLISLCAESKFGGDIQQAQNWLGNWLNLTPVMGLVKRGSDHSLVKKLTQDGYKEVERYYYRCEDNSVRLIVVRMEHPKKGKTFAMETPNGVRPKDIDFVLYNLPVLLQSTWAVIVEGEKDANTLIDWKIPATTNAGGAKKWKESYNSAFTNKNVVICRDNDEAGLAHARLMARNLASVAKTIRIICPSAIHKGDVTDWKRREGGTKGELISLIRNTPALTKEEAMWSEEDVQLLRAKEANEYPFTNQRTVTRIIDGKEKRIEEAVPMNELTANIHERFLGFPRRLGESRMFDHDRDSGRVEFIDNKAALFAWITIKAKNVAKWGRVTGAVSKDELFEGLIQTAIRYESVSLVPDYPRRADVYYAYREKVAPSPGNKCFYKLMDFFKPASEASKILLRALFAAPIYYRHGVRRPCWIIDSEAGPGVGKSMIAELLGLLYRCAPIKTNKHELVYDYKELLKRVVSSEGRTSRILLVDNVTGTFDNANFASMVTDFGISGRAPYGRGEETRPNNLTYIITANSANINNDIASRSFGVMLAKPTYNATWSRDVMAYIEEHRYTLFGDIIDILTREREPMKPSTRIPEFEQEILWPMCKDAGEYTRAIAGIMAQREEANVEEELARQCGEIIRLNLRELFPADFPENIIAFIRYEIVDMWLNDLRPATKMQDVRNFAKIGLIKEVNKDIRRYPNSGSGNKAALRSTGLMWIGENVLQKDFDGVKIIGRGKGNKAELVTVLDDDSIMKILPDFVEVEVEDVPEYAQVAAPVTDDEFYDDLPINI